MNFKFRLESDRDIYCRYRSRIFQLAGLLLFVLFSLVYRLYDMQVLNYFVLQKQSDENRFSYIPVMPYRGRIFDRNGEVLADNKVRYELHINKAIRSHEAKKIIQDVATKLAINVPLSLRLYQKNRRHIRRQQSIAFATLSYVEAARFSTISFLYPEIHLDYRIIRTYPHKHVATHILGYVGLVDDADLYDRALFPEKKIYYTRVGKNGLERYYDKDLRGDVGYKIIEVNANGKKIKDIKVEQAKDGADLQLTIDIGLQHYVDSQLEGLKGAVVIMDVWNGEILVMSSAPYYDNNAFISGVGVQELFKNNDKPLLNRAIKALYPPASIIKPFVALAGLHYRLLDRHKLFLAKPYYQISGDKRRFHDWKKGGHGWIDMNQAIAQSSDVYFYDLGYQLGIDRLSIFLSQFAFGEKTGIDVHGELSGILPDRIWKQSNGRGKWKIGDTLISAIGQGYFLTTPLQLAVAMAILANRGEVVKPSLIRFNSKKTRVNLSHRVKWYDQNHWNSVRLALSDSVSKPYGTAYKVMKKSAYSLAGKTGTAQVINLAQDPEKREKQKKNMQEKFRDHSLFAGFAPYNNPKIAIVTVVENGGNGSGIASELSKRILDRYFNVRSD